MCISGKNTFILKQFLPPIVCLVSGRPTKRAALNLIDFYSMKAINSSIWRFTFTLEEL